MAWPSSRARRRVSRSRKLGAMKLDVDLSRLNVLLLAADLLIDLKDPDFLKPCHLVDPQVLAALSEADSFDFETSQKSFQEGGRVR